MNGNPFAEVVLDGSLIAALPVALLAGFVSFASPCVLPLVPGYLGYITGLTGVDLREQRRGRILTGVVLFVLGFSAVFVLMSVVLAQLGAFAWLLGQQWIMVVLGILVMLMGVVFMGGFSWFQRDRKIERRPPPGLWGAPLLGMAFGLGWAPCIGPTFAAVQALVYVDGASTGKAVVLTTAYCLGLGVPFVLIALALRRGMGAMSFFRRHRLTLQRVGGAVLVLIGAAMATGVWSALVSWVQSEFVTDWVMPI
ncbi:MULTISPECIES: cytochrome c biogenesis CcdA family protein [Kocuria]|uniref:Cytochrome c-type biogenesis protein n=1 Tax=Kocuria marina subsp. indica TaxID=1049583 RepID=A0A1X7CD70_9MICC|nr:MULTISPECIES: cytochrome c biogenesis protein CcdA [Kocuria]MBX7556103.1 cytochrome c biogenesis protein CcdA [Streptomyces sp. tea 10]MBN6810761.1 cytochrome c biogenesis protein CcdA [Kocuria indica]MBN6842611.1 cytochrome c biogenesis protein CcdA [Kocuria indica]MCG7432054.1 cytochrome c biogenesis protein CcdA [Kocuria indica]MCT1722226.1 cytochrome c biogenesis protein CcdA [Kocuria marina]